jgi:hypothetical protein
MRQMVELKFDGWGTKKLELQVAEKQLRKAKARPDVFKWRLPDNSPYEFDGNILTRKKKDKKESE